MENQSTKLDKVMKISIIAGIAIVALSIGHYLVISLPQKTKQESAIGEIKPAEDIEIKKQSLEKFYMEVNAASTSEDWSALYEFQPPSLQEAISEEEYVAAAKKYAKANNYFSENVEIKEIQVDGNNGTVHRILTYCMTQECDGANKKVDDGLRKYEYVDNKWQIPDSDPTERAISAAAGVFVKYIEKSKKDKTAFFEKYSFGKENIKFAIRKYAQWLDDNMEQLIYVEKGLENNNSPQNNSSINFETPIQIQQSPSATSTSSTMEKINQENKQKCQQDWNKYNLCLNEYNIKMGEYNICLNENADPKKTYKPYCSKPFNFCSKPFCTY